MKKVILGLLTLLALSTGSSTAWAAGSAVKGAKMFNAKGCDSCHDGVTSVVLEREYTAAEFKAALKNPSMKYLKPVFVNNTSDTAKKKAKKTLDYMLAYLATLAPPAQ